MVEVSRELRNALMAIKVSADKLQVKLKDAPELLVYLKLINKEVKLADKLIDKVITKGMNK
jgi:signal transduction histidine kinase